jgi:hypothetical protein
LVQNLTSDNNIQRSIIPALDAASGEVHGRGRRALVSGRTVAVRAAAHMLAFEPRRRKVIDDLHLDFDRVARAKVS